MNVFPATFLREQLSRQSTGLQNQVSGVRASPSVLKSTDSMKKIIEYIKESYNELVYKVSWPTGTELSNSAVVVMIASLIIAAGIFVVDGAFEAVMRFFYNQIF